jgi:hypothetical protein
VSTYLPDELAATGRRVAATVPRMDKALDRIHAVHWAMGVAWAQGLRSGLKIGLGAGVFMAIATGVTVWLLR